MSERICPRIYPVVPAALSRRARIERRSPVERAPGDLAYLEGYDLAEAYGDYLPDILEGLLDGLQKRRTRDE